jgi:hypothetical protein
LNVSLHRITCQTNLYSSLGNLEKQNNSRFDLLISLASCCIVSNARSDKTPDCHQKNLPRASRTLSTDTFRSRRYTRQQSLMISVGWVPLGKGLHSLRRAKAAAAEAARISTDTAFPLAPPTKDQLRTTARGEAIARWQDSWSTAARLQPAYLALTSPPDGRIPPFVQGLAKHSRLTFSTGIRLLTTHAFTGEYSARFRPTSGDPHHCECGEALQTAHHVIAACLRFAAARTQHLLPLANAVSLSHIFGTKSGGEALGAFIAASQACVRPRRRDPPPEDHG